MKIDEIKELQLEKQFHIWLRKNHIAPELAEQVLKQQKESFIDELLLQ